MNYDVTIGIPVYMSEVYIRRTLESALAQTYPSIEFLLIEDAGSDDSLAILQEIQQMHQRGFAIRIISHERNVGVSSTRNQIIKEARGDYLFFMDSDDVIAEHTISLLMDNVRRYSAEIVFGSYEKIDIDGKRTVYQYPSIQLLNKDQLACFAYRKYGGIQASVCNFLVKTSLLREHKLFFLDINYWEDFVFTFDLVTYISRAVLLPDITYSYYCRKGSLSHYQARQAIPKKEVLSNVRAIDYLKDNTYKYISKDYYPNRCSVIVMTDLYMACNILKRKKDIVPSISNDEIKALMRHPATLYQITHFPQSRIKNVFLFFLGKLPPLLCVYTIWTLGKIKKLI